jgi:hypothetical protein
MLQDEEFIVGLNLAVYMAFVCLDRQLLPIIHGMIFRCN